LALPVPVMTAVQATPVSVSGKLSVTVAPATLSGPWLVTTIV